ncbi:TetR/AcrR family transcriptional regulator [Cerasicoccus maritimus]|uniref:TetR/AcrR family transcriptional regulator n=1 Tax=Cerasicoccus maritimus TaxID=490089 RepID=UPI0028528651|nr:TetR family transcriptional regulator C-terminal domain-containing protein [Cerasicoccus maritimus]
MPKKAATKSRSAWIDAYLDHLLDEGEPPASIRRFAKNQGVSEKDFYAHFANFDSLEGEVWQSLVSDTVAALEADADYQEYPAQQKLAAFYYTFLEGALDYRSFMLLRYPGMQLAVCPSCLAKFRDAFLGYVKPLLDEAKSTQEVPSRGKLNQAYPGLVYAQFLFIVDFWLKDESEQFQRTDALIEKSVTLGFDLIGAQVVDSAFDLVRFLLGNLKAS